MADDDKTPVGEAVDKPEDVKPVSAAPAPVDPNPEPPKDDVRDLIKGLSDRMDGFEETLNAVVTTGGEDDSVPGGRKPWTHRRFF